MSFEKYLEDEEKNSGKLYSDIIFALDEIQDFVSKQQLEARKFVEYLPTLKSYVDMIKNSQIDSHCKGTFEKLFSSNNSTQSSMEKFKNDNSEKFATLRNCVKCKCLNCADECIMEGCNRCDKYGYIASCDKKTTSVYIFKNKKLELCNNKTGQTDMYNVLAIIQDKEYNQLFILIESRGEKFVLYYYPGTSEDTYGEVTDVEDFNFAIDAYEKIDL